MSSFIQKLVGKVRIDFEVKKGRQESFQDNRRTQLLLPPALKVAKSDFETQIA